MHSLDRNLRHVVWWGEVEVCFSSQSRCEQSGFVYSTAASLTLYLHTTLHYTHARTPTHVAFDRSFFSDGENIQNVVPSFLFCIHAFFFFVTTQCANHSRHPRTRLWAWCPTNAQSSGTHHTPSAPTTSSHGFMCLSAPQDKAQSTCQDFV